MARLRFDYSKALAFVGDQAVDKLEGAVRNAHNTLHQGTGAGSDYLGWLDLPVNYDRDEFARIQAAAKRIQDEADALVVIGIGGSYLGARATIDALSHPFYNQLPKGKRKGPEIYYLGKDLSPVYLTHVLEALEGKNIAVNVISKSGTTTEPAVAFRFFREILTQKYGKDGARKRIYATTDKARGALRKLADSEGYETFVIPDDVGGRYSVLTPVGLLPIAAAGLDISQLMAGAAAAREAYATTDLAGNPAYQYAAIRHALYTMGKQVEFLTAYEPSLHYTAEWWKQLFGESQGKENKGVLPAAVDFTTDLHSMGQYVQEGLRILYETVLMVERPAVDVPVPNDPDNIDGLNFLSGQSMDFVNKKAFEGTLLAHTDGGVPNLVVTMPELSEFAYGEMLYFFEKACAVSGYMLGINPFDQPGVEAYKQNMFALLGKPGFEERRAELQKRLQG
ncbi:MAG: glucose-6-phosphate isomerase [Mycobacterium leprae]